MRAHLEFLADDALEGRGTGQRGGTIAARYIAAQFRRLGLEPMGDAGTYFQTIPPARQPVPAPDSTVVGDGAAVPESTAVPEATALPDSAAAPESVRTRTPAAAPPSGDQYRESVNVIARLPGRGPLADEVVVLGAHYDHLGVGAPVEGDSIYNGALDNASGVAGMLAIAEALVRAGIRPARSVLFVAFGGEELGLHGSQRFVHAPPVPLSRIAAMLNMDILNVRAPTADLSALGLELSSLGGLFRHAATAEGFRITAPDAAVLRFAVLQDFFNRSDHAPFARAGVPVLFLYVGDELPGQGPGSALPRLAEYLERHYHQPSDELSLVTDLDGAARTLRVVARTLLAAADAPARPRWAAGAPFGPAGEARRPPQ